MNALILINYHFLAEVGEGEGALSSSSSDPFSSPLEDLLMELLEESLELP